MTRPSIQLRRSNGPSHGFSLIEILVVITVIAILAALLLPSLNRARRSARSARCLSNLRQLGIATQTYIADWGGRFPFAGRDWPPASFEDWPTLMQKHYIPNKSFFICPLESKPAFNIAWTEYSGPGYGYSNPNVLPFPCSYYYYYAFYHAFDCANNPGAMTQQGLGAVASPSHKALIVCYARPTDDPYSGMGWAHRLSSLAIVFVDGHASLLSYNDLNPGGLQPYNLDWTVCGIKGRDLK